MDHTERQDRHGFVMLGNLEPLRSFKDPDLRNRLGALQHKLDISGVPYGQWPTGAILYPREDFADLRGDFANLRGWIQCNRPTWIGLVNQILESVGKDEFIFQTARYLQNFDRYASNKNSSHSIVRKLVHATQTMSPAWTSETNRLRMARNWLATYAPSFATIMEIKDHDQSMDVQTWCNTLLRQSARLTAPESGSRTLHLHLDWPQPQEELTFATSPTDKYHRCGKPGHWVKDCRVRLDSNRAPGNRFHDRWPTESTRPFRLRPSKGNHRHKQTTQFGRKHGRLVRREKVYVLDDESGYEATDSETEDPPTIDAGPTL